MKKTKYVIASLSLIMLLSVFSLIPVGQAASSTIWVDTSSELVWELTEEALDESLVVLNTNTSYRKLNFTEILEGSDHINVSGKLYSATEADVLANGYTNQSIWDFESLGLSPEIYDADETTHFASYFNEQNTNLTILQTFSPADQMKYLMAIGFVMEDILFAATFVYVLSQGFGATFGHNFNSSTITSVTDRNIVYSIGYNFSIDDSGHWQTTSLTSDLNLTYGVTSNVLLRSKVLSSVNFTEWNGTHYVTEFHAGRSSHEIKYPESLLSDFPVVPGPDPKPKIPGYSVSIVIGAIVLGSIPVYVIRKRKKK